MRPAGKPETRATLVMFAAIVVVRLLLTADRDILAFNQPYDDYWFVAAARRWIWGGDYNHMAFAQLPLYAMWLKAWSLLGVPARLAIDLAWLAAIAYLAAALAAFCRKTWPGILLLLFLAFHPLSIAWFDRAWSDCLLAVCSLLVMAAMMEIWNLREVDARASPRKKMAVVVASVAFAAALQMRKEGPLLLPPLLMLGLCSWYRRDRWWRGGNAARLGRPLLLYPLASALALGALLAGANHLRWGVFARYEVAAPGYLRAVSTLNAIDPGAATPRYVTVTAATRKAAYAASPTFRELQPYLEGALGEQVSRASAAYTSGVAGEIANGWFYWTLRDAAALAGWHSSAPAAEEKYGAMADELERAFVAGRLTQRTVLASFIDPDWRKWLPGLPRAFLAETGQVADLRDINLYLDLPEDATPLQLDNYLIIAGRRNSLPARASVAGWVVAPEGSEIGLGQAGEVPRWATLSGPARPDVPGGLPFLVSAAPGETPTQLQLRRPNGQTALLPLAALKAGQVQTMVGVPEATLGVDRLDLGERKFRANRWLAPALLAWSWLGALFAVAGFVALLLPAGGAARVVLLLMVLAIVSRSGLLALIEASSWSALQNARYTFPAVPLFACFGVLGLWLLSNFCARLRSSARPPARKP